MPTTLTTKATEESTYVITAAFTDEDGSAVTPKDGTVWSLYDRGGNVINSRQDVAIVAATSVDIVLSGDDLQITGVSDDGVRKLTIEGTYDSSLGSDLPLNDECTFSIEDLVGVT